jgi:uncharacterized BrkB/YihY/UPF0761 family membrane protein
MVGTFNFDQVFQSIKDVFISIIQLPFELWYPVPLWIKLTLTAILLLMAIGCIYGALKNKDKWKYRDY